MIAMARVKQPPIVYLAMRLDHCVSTVGLLVEAFEKPDDDPAAALSGLLYVLRQQREELADIAKAIHI